MNGIGLYKVIETKPALVYFGSLVLDSLFHIRASSEVFGGRTEFEIASSAGVKYLRRDVKKRRRKKER